MHSHFPRFGLKLKGSALIVILIILGLAAAFLVSALKSNPQVERDKITADALAKAKDALIGYAATYGDRNDKRVFGHLPCPDISGGTGGLEGSEAGSCSGKNISAIGRLPWKTLGLSPLRDSSGECLWYAISGSFKSSTKPDLLNWDSVGQFEIFDADGTTKIAGSTPGNRAVAVIFSVGSALAGQNRASVSDAPECGGNYTAGGYLETSVSINNSVVNGVAEAITQFIAGKKSDSFNDRMLYITADEIFAKRIEKRKDFPGTYFSDTTNLTPTIINNFTSVSGYLDNIDTKNQTIAGISTNPPVYGLLQKTAQCMVKYAKNNSTAADKRMPWAAPLNIADFTNDSFDDSAGLLAGRPPFAANTSAAATPANLLVTSSNSYRLLTTARCTIGWENVAGAGGTTSKDGWWDKWKDHLFYAVADAFKPSSSSATQAYPCSTGTCLTVDGVGPYAAVLIYAGKKLASPAQSRDTLAQKTVASNYLEGVNATSITAGTGAAYTKITNTSANDVLICINQDLTIDPTCANPVANGSTGGGGVYTGIVPPEVSQDPGWTGDTGIATATLSDGTIISVTTASGSTPTIVVSNTGIGVNSASGSNTLDLGSGEQMSFTFASAQKYLAILVGMLKRNDFGYITFKNNGTTVGTATIEGCSSSNTSMFNNIVPVISSPTFNQAILTAGTNDGYYINQVVACATLPCAISGSAAAGVAACTSWVSH